MKGMRTSAMIPVALDWKSPVALAREVGRREDACMHAYRELP